MIGTSSIFGFITSKRPPFRGNGYFAGEPADSPSDPSSPDGRARIMNEPARVKILVLDRSTMTVIANTLSSTNGTWRIQNLNPDLYFMVIGVDGTGQVNAAIQDWVKPAQME